MTALWHGIAHYQNVGGHLHIDGISVGDLVKKYGSPLYIYSADRIRENARRLIKTYRAHYPKFDLYYAVKANNHPEVVKILLDEGVGADCSCIHEVQIASHAGVDTSNMLYSGVYQRQEHLIAAMEQGVCLNLDCLEQLQSLANGTAAPEKLCLRVNPGVGGSGDEGLVFAGPDAKFGIDDDKIVTAYNVAREWGVKHFGIHMMTGSNILEPDYFEVIVNALMDIAGRIKKEAGVTLEFIDIGGSLGIPYRPEQSPLDLDAVAATVARIVKAKSKEYGLDEPTLIQEPGRYLVGDAGMLITQVTSIKRSQRTFVGVDAGMQTLLRPALYGAYHHIFSVNRLQDTATSPFDVVGPVCENTDVLAGQRQLPINTAVGDLFAIADTGAYGFCMSSQYNSQPRPAEVLVDGGIDRLITPRENPKLLLRQS